jgi:nitrite reductase/ring-hydroxylating ferredoxin subunit
VKNKDIKMLKNLSLGFKKKCLLGGLFFLLAGCSTPPIERNPYLPDLRFSIPVNLNLPQYDNLLFAGGAILLPNHGHKGVIVFNLNGNSYLAWEASCPNHLPNDCSQTQIVGVLAECSCEDYQYSLATGQLLNPEEGEDTPYSMIMYQTVLRGNTLEISN